MRNYVAVLIAAVVLIAFLIVSVVVSPAPDWAVSDSFFYTVVAAYGLTFVLGAVFAQNRMTFVSVLYVASLVVVQYQFFVRGDGEKGRAALLLASINLPVLSVIFYHMRECRLASKQGLVIIAVALLSAFGMFAVPELRSFRLAASDPEARLLQPVSSLFSIPLTGLVVFVACVPALLIRKKHDAPAVGPMLCIALAFVFLALNFESSAFSSESQRAVWRWHMFGAGLVLFLAVLDTSWRHANIDELTGLPGRRQLYRHLGHLGGAYHIAIADIDHFKRINDRHGHPTGDQVLRYVATQLREEKAGKAYRVGGEEFVLVLENMSKEGALEALDALRERIMNRPFGVRSKKRKRKKPENAPKTAGKSSMRIKVTVSIGAAEPNERHRIASEVMAAADKALYRAKKSGRNCVKIAR